MDKRRFSGGGLERHSAARHRAHAWRAEAGELRNPKLRRGPGAVRRIQPFLSGERDAMVLLAIAVAMAGRADLWALMRGLWRRGSRGDLGQDRAKLFICAAAAAGLADVSRGRAPGL
ncbi:MAG: hypothetical protein ACLPPF_01480 [Rhodomicrobium sp.]